MRLLIKKLYCPSCQKLVKGNEQVVDNIAQVVCPRCKRVLCFWNGIIWRYTKEGA